MSPTENHRCTECLKVYDTRSKYNQHLKTHSRPFQCDKCERKFALRLDLRRHQRARHLAGQARFICAFFECAFQATRKDNLKRHISKSHNYTLQISNHGQKKDNIDDMSDGSQAENDSNPGSSPDIADAAPVENRHLLLVQAASSGNITFLRRAIQAGIPLDTVSDDGSSALHCAARAGQVEMVAELFQLGASITILNQKKRTPFQEAILGGDISTIKYMLSSNMSAIETEVHFLFTFELSVRAESVHVAEVYIQHIEKTAAWETYNHRMLYLAIKYSHVYFVRWLLSSAIVDINRPYGNGSRPIHQATRIGHPGILKALLESKVIEINVFHWQELTPLHTALCWGANCEVLQLLLKDERVDVNVDSYSEGTPLHQAAERDMVAEMRLLLAHPKIDVNIPTKPLQMTPLHQAVVNSQLLPSNASVDNPADSFHSIGVVEQSTSEAIIISSHLEAIRILYQAPGIDLTLQDSDGRTALQLAVLRRNWPVAQCLVQYLEVKKSMGSSTGVHLPRLRSSNVPGLVRRLLYHEDFQSQTGITALSFGVARDRVPKLAILISRTKAFHEVIKGDDRAAALLCAVCMAFHSTEHLEYVLQQPTTDVNCHVVEGLTAIHVAVAINSTQAVRLLLEHLQINVNIWMCYPYSRTRAGLDVRVGETARKTARRKYGHDSIIAKLFIAHERRLARLVPSDIRLDEMALIKTPQTNASDIDSFFDAPTATW